MSIEQNCIFCRIVRGELPSRKIYEDTDILAFHDIHPVAPVHFLVIPKKHVDSLAHVDESLALILGRIMVLTGKLAFEAGSPNGFRIIVNTGRVGRQDVFHLHVHVLGGAEPLPSMINNA
jgi:histidine triad (HIT) family protein